jgi:hypothetical protein
MAKDRPSRPDHEPSSESDDHGIDFEDLSSDEAWSWDADEWPRIPESVRRMYIELMLKRGLGRHALGPRN